MKAKEVLEHLEKAIIEDGLSIERVAHLYIKNLRASDKPAETKNLRRLLARYETGHADTDLRTVGAEVDRVLHLLA